MDVDPVYLTIERAVPSGLILNELVSNALKHAFPFGGEGIVTLTVRDLKDGTCMLSVADNGIGISTSTLDESRSLGLRLVRSLAAQLGGRFELVPQQRGTDARLICEVHNENSV